MIGITPRGLVGLLFVLALVGAPYSARADAEAAQKAFESGNIEIAIREWTPLAKAGDAAAQHGLWLSLEKRNLMQALSWLYKAAKAGYAPAQDDLAGLYRTGRGYPKNSATALNLYRQAAEQRYAPAQRHLGEMYAEGLGVAKDEAEAKRWIERAAAQGVDPARVNIGTKTMALDAQRGIEAFERGDFATALKELQPLAEQGHAEAQNYLGIMYYGGQGLLQDYAKAVKLYREAAEQGHADAQFRLGLTYDDGQGVPQDYAEARRWYRKAADQGDAKAQFQLGVMYDKGKGVPQDFDAAARYYSQVIALGDAPDALPIEIKVANLSAINLSVIFLSGKHYDRVIKLLEGAAGRGSDVAAINIASMHQRGLGALEDPIAIYQWLLIAADPSSERTTLTGTSDTAFELAQRLSAEVEKSLTAQQIAKAKQSAKAWITEHRR